MLSEKLDLIMSAESAAAQKIAEAEKNAEEIIFAAKMKADTIRTDKVNEAKEKAADILAESKEKCDEISEMYAKNADADADRLAKVASKNEPFGINYVIMKIVP